MLQVKKVNKLHLPGTMGGGFPVNKPESREPHIPFSNLRRIMNKMPIILPGNTE